MKRVLLDTNIYGRIIEERQENIIRESINKDVFKGKFVIYGCNIVIKELRATSKKIKIGNSKLRMALLNLFDILVKEHSFRVTAEMKELAYHYYNIYKKIGGIRSEKEIIKDFFIIAAATIKKLDIVYSEDNKTMLSEKALESYTSVNDIKRLRTPKFESYSNFMKEIRRLLI